METIHKRVESLFEGSVFSENTGVVKRNLPLRSKLSRSFKTLSVAGLVAIGTGAGLEMTNARMISQANLHLDRFSQICSTDKPLTEECKQEWNQASWFMNNAPEAVLKEMITGVPHLAQPMKI